MKIYQIIKHRRKIKSMKDWNYKQTTLYENELWFEPNFEDLEEDI